MERAELLRVDQVETRDDFFDLGGHSLLAAELAVRMRDVLGREVPVGEIIRHRTLGGTLRSIDRAADTPAQGERR